MKQITLKPKTIYLILFFSFFMGYFTLTDLQISIAIVNESSVWAIFLEKLGEIPGLLVLFIGIHIYIANTWSFKKVIVGTKTITLLVAVIFITCYIVIVVYYGIKGSYDLLIKNSVLIICGISAFNLAVQFFLNNKKFNVSIIHFSKITVLLGLYSYLFLIQPIKILWGRVRFKDLDSVYSNFSEWFVINGINGNQSFPSGHSAMGWMLLPLLILLRKSRIKKRILFIILVIWALAVGLSRIIVGAHYASDVFFGAFIVIIVYIITTSRLTTE